MAKDKSSTERLPNGVTVTNNYEIFKEMPGNRLVDEAHVKRLQKLMLTNGNLTSEFPIIVDKEGYVVDGQHRLAALKGLGWEIGYRVEEAATIETVRAINQGNRNWSWRDLAYSYASRGNDNYNWFLSFIDQYGLRFSPALIIASGKRGGKDSALGDFQRGELMIADKAKAHDTANQMVAIQRQTGIYNNDFSFALITIMRSPAYDHERMMKKIRQQGEMLSERAKRGDYMRQLEEIYNFGFSEGSRSRLF